MYMKNKLHWLFCLVGALLLSFAGCSDGNPVTPDPEPQPEVEWETVNVTPTEWDGEKRGSISYQLLVYSFADSNGDGCGDLQGIIDKLD